MKIKLTMMVSVVSLACVAALCAAAGGNNRSGGPPGLTDRVVTLEQVVLAQQQDIEIPMQQVEPGQSSIFAEVETQRMKGLAERVGFVFPGEESPGGWDGWRWDGWHVVHTIAFA